VAHPKEGKAHQRERRPVHPVRGKAQEKERRLRRVEGSEVACVARPQEAQQGEYRRSSWEDLRKRVE